MPLVGDPGWRITTENDQLVVTAGADAVWLIDDVPPSTADIVARYWTDDPPAIHDVPDTIRPIVEHLAGLGALKPATADTPVDRVAIRFVGDPVDAFTDALQATGACIDDNQPAPLTIVVRTNAPLRALVDVATDLHASTSRSVLCDLAFHHTVGLGPDVHPGDTACFGCLAGRVGTRWGDPDPPRQPRATADAPLAAHLVATWLANGATLVNATVSFDLATLTSRREALWRFPSCPVCGEWTPSGRIALPW